MSAPIKWHGGKSYLAKRIIELFDDHTHYVEPYAGGLAVLFRKPDKWIEGYSEVVNDLNGDLMNFWSVLQDEQKFAQFQRRVEVTPFSQVEFDSAYWVGGTTSVDRAVAFFIQYRQSRQGLGKDFATLSRNRTRRGMNEQASSWWSAVDGLGAAHERLKRVVVTNTDAIRLIRQQDGPKTLFYLDPIYVHETRTVKDAYACEMDRQDHRVLLVTLAGMMGKFILSGYRCDLYYEFADANGWHRTDIEIDNKSSSAKVKEKKTECLWRNYGS